MALDLNNFSNNQTEVSSVIGDKTLRVGIIGTGGISGAHIKTYMDQPDVEIVAGCDLIPGKAEKSLLNTKLKMQNFSQIIRK